MLYWLVSGFVFFADFISKKIVVEKVELNETIEVSKDKLYVTHIKNTGVANGFMRKYPHAVNLLSPVVFLFVAGVFRKVIKESNNNHLLKLANALILGGGLGNMADRFKNKSVTDFLRFGKKKDSLVYNFADLSIFLGAVVFALGIFVGKDN